MSANNVFCTQAAIHVFSDGLLFDESGKVIMGFGGKTRTIFSENYNAVIGLTGFAHLLPLIEGAIIQSRAELHNLEHCLGDILREYEAKAAKFTPPWGNYRATIAGWSLKSEESICVAVNSFDEGDCPAFTPRRVSEHIDPPYKGFVFDPARPVESGIALLEQQRSKKYGAMTDGSDRVGFHRVGGFVQHSVVTRDGIDQKIIHRWPNDRVGTFVTAASGF